MTPRYDNDKHYLAVTAECPVTIVLRVPLPVPSRSDLMRALTAVMREHGCRQRDIKSIDDLVSQSWHEHYVVEQLDRACAGDARVLPKLWLYDWKKGAFRLARQSTVPADRRIAFFQTQAPLEEASPKERHPTMPHLVSRRGAGELAGCEPGVVARLEEQGAIAFARYEERRSWYRSSDAVKLRDFAASVSAETAKVDSQRKAAAMWMLHIQGATYREIGRAFGLSVERIRQIVLKYERTLDVRAKQAEHWLQQQTARRERAVVASSKDVP